MPRKEDIHACWSLTPQFDAVTGELTTHGLLALGGHGGDGAVRELKKRCDAELNAGEPLAGCAMYVNLIMGWVKPALVHKERLKGTQVTVNFAADKSFREGFERSFRVAGEDEIADLIEETWAQYKKEGDIPDSVRMDVEDEITAILEETYCDVGITPDDFTPRELERSESIALTLGKRKPRREATGPMSEETAPPTRPAEESSRRTQVDSLKEGDVHAIWSLAELKRRCRGRSGALDELKQRCEAELELMGRPLVACTMYVGLATELGMPNEIGELVAGDYQIEEDPESFSELDRSKSKRIALALGERNQQTAKQPETMAAKIKREIEAKMKAT